MSKKQQAETVEHISDVEMDIQQAPPSNIAIRSVTPQTDAYIDGLLPPESRQRLYAGLPSHIRPEVFERNLFNAVATNQWLKNYAPALVFREISKAAALGLLLDPILGEAYLIEGYNGKTKQKEPQLRVGYKGMNKLARQSGNVSGLWCHEIHQKDFVKVNLGHPKEFRHEPVLFADRGPIVGYAATISYKDGNFDFEPMSLEDCLKIRDRSDAWKAFKADKIKSTPWGTDENEMCKKTVFRRLAKRQDLSPQMRLAIQIEDEAEFPHMMPHEPAPQLTAPAPPPDEPGTEPGAQSADVRRAPSPPTDRPTGASRQRTFKSPKAMLAHIQTLCDKITADEVKADPECLQRLWDEKIEPLLTDAFPPDVDAAQAIFNMTSRKFEP